jgi:hypothetical protein
MAAPPLHVPPDAPTSDPPADPPTSIAGSPAPCNAIARRSCLPMGAVVALSWRGRGVGVARRRDVVVNRGSDPPR